MAALRAGNERMAEMQRKMWQGSTARSSRAPAAGSAAFSPGFPRRTILPDKSNSMPGAGTGSNGKCALPLFGLTAQKRSKPARDLPDFCAKGAMPGVKSYASPPAQHGATMPHFVAKSGRKCARTGHDWATCGQAQRVSSPSDSKLAAGPAAEASAAVIAARPAQHLAGARPRIPDPARTSL